MEKGKKRVEKFWKDVLWKGSLQPSYSPGFQGDPKSYEDTGKLKIINAELANQSPLLCHITLRGGQSLP